MRLIDFIKDYRQTLKGTLATVAAIASMGVAGQAFAQTAPTDTAPSADAVPTASNTWHFTISPICNPDTLPKYIVGATATFEPGKQPVQDSQGAVLCEMGERDTSVIQEALGYNTPELAHMPMYVINASYSGNTGTALSEKEALKFVQDGYQKEAPAVVISGNGAATLIGQATNIPKPNPAGLSQTREVLAHADGSITMAMVREQQRLLAEAEPVQVLEAGQDIVLASALQIDENINLATLNVPNFTQGQTLLAESTEGKRSPSRTRDVAKHVSVAVAAAGPVAKDASTLAGQLVLARYNDRTPTPPKGGARLRNDQGIYVLGEPSTQLFSNSGVLAKQASGYIPRLPIFARTVARQTTPLVLSETFSGEVSDIQLTNGAIPDAAQSITLLREFRSAAQSAVLRRDQSDLEIALNAMQGEMGQRVMDADAIYGARIARYLVNKNVENRDELLGLITNNLDSITAADAALGSQMANFVIRNDRGELREEARAHKETRVTPKAGPVVSKKIFAIGGGLGLLATFAAAGALFLRAKQKDVPGLTMDEFEEVLHTTRQPEHITRTAKQVEVHFPNPCIDMNASEEDIRNPRLYSAYYGAYQENLVVARRAWAIAFPLYLDVVSFRPNNVDIISPQEAMHSVEAFELADLNDTPSSSEEAETNEPHIIAMASRRQETPRPAANAPNEGDEFAIPEPNREAVAAGKTHSPRRWLFGRAA
ncbi:MAG: hypothetical protein WAO98_10745 [Alphaproteobacteria bacterium]